MKKYQRKFKMKESTLLAAQGRSLEIVHKINSSKDIDRKIQEYGGIEKITDEWLSGKRTLKAIAAELNMSAVALQTRVHKYSDDNGTNAHMQTASNTIDNYGIERILHRYIDERHKLQDIAADVGVNVASIYYYLKSHNLPTTKEELIMLRCNECEGDPDGSNALELKLKKHRKKKLHIEQEETVHSNSGVYAGLSVEDAHITPELRHELKKLERKCSISNCMNCLYRNRTDSLCWYTMVTNKTACISNRMCKHFIDRRELND
jgi:hypothetical protein